MFSRLQKFIVGILLLATTFIWYVIFSFHGGLLRVAMLDVGQGDAIFIETPSGKQMLIDGGYNGRVLSELGKIMPAYDKSIDVVIATHTDADHLGGLVEVLKHYDVERIFTNGMTASTTVYADWVGLIKEHGIVEDTILLGDRIVLGDGVEFDILGPWPEDFAPRSKKANESMIVGRLKYGAREFFLAGDLEKGDEIRLALSKTELASDVLKVAHHGSANASTNLFLERVHPEIAVVSVGANNRYGHPVLKTLERIKHIGAKLFRTDQDGMVIFETDGRDLRITRD
ncbi:MAG: ComEC/Rec2 family competence protein [Patescibacteria group bacterium]